MTIKQRKKKGFTIIEVVLVLAIAGLIFAMVLIALPALQKAQRNSQRKRDLGLIVAQMEKFRANNSGISVTDSFTNAFEANGFCTFYNKYIDDEMVDPSTGTPYKVSLNATTRVIDCKKGKDALVERGYDPDVRGRSGSKWAKMDVGDIQYNDVAMCNGEIFDDNMGRSANLHVFAIRMYLEGGGVACQDNGGKPIKASVETGPFDPISAFGIINR